MSKSQLKCLIKIRKMLGDSNGKMSFDTGRKITLNNGAVVNVGEFVSEETRLWRQTWILPVLDAIIATAEKRATSRDKWTIECAAKDWTIEGKEKL